LPSVIPTPKAKGADDAWTLQVFDFAATWTQPVGIVVRQGVGKIHATFPINGTIEAAKETAREYFIGIVQHHQPGDAVQLLDQKGDVRFTWNREQATFAIEKRQSGASPNQR
jgi:hypothetical protein